MSRYEKKNKPVSASGRQLAAGKNAIQLQDNRPKTVSNRTDVIQRAIGFEFETGWLIDRATEIHKRNPGIISGITGLGTSALVGGGLFAAGALTGGLAIGAGLAAGAAMGLGSKALLGPSLPERRPLKKSEIVKKFNGFTMEADEAGKNSEIEFVTAPIEEGANGISTLKEVMNKLRTLTKALDAKKGSQSFTLDQVSGFNKGFNVYTINPTGDLSANAQVTGGIKLGRIPQLAEDAGTRDSFARTSLFGMDGDFKANAFALAGRKADATRTKNKELKGLITILVSYINESKRPSGYDGLEADLKHKIALPYAKHTTILMARTDLGTLFNSIPKNVIKPYIDDPKSFVQLIVTAAGDVNANSLFFAKGIKAHNSDTTDELLEENKVDEAYRVIYPEITLGQWLTALTKGKDLLTNRTWKYTWRGSGTDFEGMGRLGSRKDRVGKNKAAEAPIFEFRKVKTAMNADQWKDWSVKTFKYISDLNK